MKKLVLLSAVGLMMLGGCAVHTHRPPPPVAVRPAVVVRTPHVRVRPVRARRCAYNKCRRRCTIWGCWNRCRRVYRRCH